MTFDPNIPILEELAQLLEPLLQDLVLVGGCAVSFLITDKAQTPLRPTNDVDFITEAITLPDYYAQWDRLLELGFQPDQEINCRLRKGVLIIDLMPSSPVLGITNRWYAKAAQNSVLHTLPSGKRLRNVTAPFFIATKLEAFFGRGKGDYGHQDIEDIVTVVDGRPELAMEIEKSDPEVRDYIKDEMDGLMGDELFVDTLQVHLRPHDQNRLPVIVERLRAIAGL